MGTPTSHSATPPYSWSQYEVRTGDFNNNGLTDLVWNRVDGTNTSFIALSNGDGTFEEMPLTQAGASGWDSRYRFETGNVTGQNGDDLIWNRHFDINRTYVGLSNGDGTFGDDNVIRASFGTDNNDHGTSDGWRTTLHQFAVADINGNGRDDLIWYRYGQDNHRVWIAQSSGTEPGNMFQPLYNFNRSDCCWGDYVVLTGNITGNAGADLVWAAPERDIPRIQRDLSSSSPLSLTAGETQDLENIAEGASDYVVRLLDVNGDGRKDILMNRMGAVSRSIIGLGRSNGGFDFSRASQDHPANDQWGQFDILTGDITGDTREDVVYVNADATNTVYVGIARASAQ